MVAPARDETSPKLKMPTSVTGTVPFAVASSTLSPTFRFSSSASFLLIATSPGARGSWPLTSVFGLKGSGSQESTRLGAPPLDPAYLPSTTSAPIAWTCPSTLPTPGTCFAWSITESGNGPACAESVVNAVFFESTMSVPSSPVLKMSENPLVI